MASKAFWIASLVAGGSGPPACLPARSCRPSATAARAEAFSASDLQLSGFGHPEREQQIDGLERIEVADAGLGAELLDASVRRR